MGDFLCKVPENKRRKRNICGKESRKKQLKIASKTPKIELERRKKKEKRKTAS